MAHLGIAIQAFLREDQRGRSLLRLFAECWTFSGQSMPLKCQGGVQKLDGVANEDGDGGADEVSQVRNGNRRSAQRMPRKEPSCRNASTGLWW
jgi:hypothetical protein